MSEEPKTTQQPTTKESLKDLFRQIVLVIILYTIVVLFAKLYDLIAKYF